MKHRFYCVSAPTLSARMKYALQAFPDLLPYDGLKRFINEQFPNVLISVGDVIDRDKTLSNHLGMQKFERFFAKERRCRFLNECLWAVDNGGFQISQGFIPKEHLDAYRADFHRFLCEQHVDMNLTFTLDMVPNVDKNMPCIFNTAGEMYEYNVRSYEEAAALPPEIRSIIRCVFHFRGPRVFRTWKRMIIENNLAATFKHFGTGGLAQNSSINLPVVPFTIPLVPLLNYKKSYGETAFDYHVLGQGSPMAIISMCFIEEHIRAVHDMHVHFTHDATTPFHEISYRKMMLMDTRALTMQRADMSSNNVNHYFDDGRATVDALYDIVNHDLSPYGLGPFDPNKQPYQDECGRPTHIGYALALFNALYNRTKMWHWAQGIVAACYPIYRAGEIQSFKKRFSEIIGDVICPFRHDNRIAADVAIIVNTLEFLTTLDSEYADSLVCNRLLNEEHQDLKGSI